MSPVRVWEEPPHHVSTLCCLVKTLAFRTKLRYNKRRYAGLAQLLERFLAMEEARS